MTSTADTPEPTFEEARAELERIVSRLEGGEALLEDAIALWERGEALYRLCLTKLDAAHGRVEQLGRELSEVTPPQPEREPAPTEAGESDHAGPDAGADSV